MSKQVIGFGVSRGGKAVVSHRTRLDDNFAVAFKEGERFCVTFEKSTRSLRLNYLYWWWVSIIMDKWGWSKGYTHNYCKTHFNMQTELIPDHTTGELKEESYPGSTAELPTDKFIEMLTEMQQHFAEQDCDLPWPDEMR